MERKRRIEIFTAGCPVCSAAVALVESMACPSCNIEVLDLNDAEVARRAAGLSIRSVPAVVVDGVLSSCCNDRGISEDMLRTAGVGQPL